MERSRKRYITDTEDRYPKTIKTLKSRHVGEPEKSASTQRNVIMRPPGIKKVLSDTETPVGPVRCVCM